MQKHILIVEDDIMQQKMLSTLIKRHLHHKTYTAGHGKEALEILAEDQEHQIALVILDLTMPVMDGMETLKYIKKTYPTLPVIMLTGNKNINTAVDAIKAGAQDFLSKPYEGERMITTIRNTLKTNTLEQEVQRLKKEQSGQLSFTDLIGHDGGLKQSVEIARRVASSDIPALITGPTGSGKEMFARAIHTESPRHASPFIAVNCGAIPDQLVESILFGHEKGSFTGATEQMPGKFREADGGTIFLDEVGELPPNTQVKLLRVLQQQEVETIGAAKPIPVNVRVISATNRDLEHEIRQGNFRQDLYFRLNVLELRLPALSERQEDIIPLCTYFIERYCAQHNRTTTKLSEDAQKWLKSKDWTGNVRELENTMNRALVLCPRDVLNRSDFSITQTHEPSVENTSIINIGQSRTNLSIEMMDETGQFKTLTYIELEAMKLALEHHENNITQASKSLGMAKSTFYRKMKDYGLH